MRPMRPCRVAHAATTPPDLQAALLNSLVSAAELLLENWGHRQGFVDALASGAEG
jgi:hypothetical protein